jgi:hypothetical protein
MAGASENSTFKFGDKNGLNATGKKLLSKSIFMGKTSPEAIWAAWKKNPQKFTAKKDALILILSELQADINSARSV